MIFVNSEREVPSESEILALIRTEVFSGTINQCPPSTSTSSVSLAGGSPLRCIIPAKDMSGSFHCIACARVCICLRLGVCVCVCAGEPE